MADGPELLLNDPAAGSFLADYRTGDASITPFYAGDAWRVGAYRSKAREVDGRFDASARERLQEMLRPTNADARERLESISGGRGYLVTTGQQAGLLGGPLFTLYKALSAVSLAETLQQHLDVPVLAVFWVASEDHDWAEVNEVHLLDTGNDHHRLQLPEPLPGGYPEDAAGPGPSMARRPLDASVNELFARLTELLPPTDFRDGLLERYRAAYAPGTSVSDAFERLLASLLADVPIAFVQASDPELKRASVPILRAELERGGEHEQVLARTAGELRAAGHEPQVPIQEGAENVFHEAEAGRERLLRSADGWETRGRGIRLSRDEAFRLLEEEPGRFSPNVLLRPVVESAVLPTLAYVGGPAEVRYFAQLRGLFEAHGVGMPLVMPRASLAVIEGKVRKVLDKFDLTPSELAEPPQELARRVVAEDMPDEVEAALKQLRAAIGSGYASLSEAVAGIDPTLKGPVGGARGAAFSELGDIEKRIVRQLKSRNETTLEQIEKARVNLFPTGKPQERVLNALQYLTRYGTDLIEQVRRAVAWQLEDRGERD